MNTKLKCLLLDDELPSLTYLKLLCEKIPEIEVVRAFNDPQEFLHEYSRIDFDVLITDIEMPGIKGIELVEHLEEKSIIFTTAYTEYAADAYDLQAVDYVRKPLVQERLQQAIDKVLLLRKKSSKNANTYIQVNSDKGRYILYFNQIQHITTSSLDSRDKVVLLTNDTSITLKNVSFQMLEKALPKAKFCRINKKEIIALSIVTAFSHDQITSNLSSEGRPSRTFSLSEKFKADFIQKLSI